MALTVVGLLTALPGRASAQDPAAARRRCRPVRWARASARSGQVVISGEMFTPFNKANNQGWAFNLQPAADYFLIPNVTVGGALGFGIGSDEHGFSVAARAGFNFNFTEHVSVWGKAGITYGWRSEMGASASESFFNLFAPINYHIVPHVFIGVGPFYNLKMSGDPRRRTTG